MNLQFVRVLVLLAVVGTLAVGCTTTPVVKLPSPELAPLPASAAAGSPPPMPSPVAPVAQKMAIAADFFFASSGVKLDSAGMAGLSELAQKARGLELYTIVVVGRADSTERPTDAAAMALSKRRADAVKKYLLLQGVVASRVYTEGKGRTLAVADTRTANNPAMHRRVEVELVETRDTAETGPSNPPKGQIPVLFGTNRSKTGNNDPRDYFGSNESEADPDSRLTLGRVTVKVPPNRQRGEIKEPGFFKVTLERVSSSPLASAIGISTIQAADLKTDFSFAGPIEELTDKAFADALSASMARTKSKSALVYVHGFANSFKDAAFRTAQFAYDLADEKYDVVPVLFSWPSNPSKFNYVGAGDRTWSAGKQLATFLDKLTATTGAGVVHIVAHSKGAEVLGIAFDTLRTNNLLTFGKDGVTLVPRFNQIVLAAPDIRVNDFASLVFPAIASHHSVTNYVSSNDAALRASKRINEGARAGDSGSTSFIVKGIETIDVTAVNYRSGGHSSFADSPRVIADIRQQLAGTTPGNRRLERVTRREVGYWLLKE